MIISILIFLLGLSTGSFLNAVIWRLEKGESVIFAGVRPPLNQRGSDPRALARSYCPYCKTTLRWHDLIPVLSFLFLRGKCRYCGKQISIQYPVVEVSTALLFVAIVNFQFPISNFQSVFQFSILNWATLCYMLYVTCSIIVIFVYDLKHYIIPDKILFPAIAVSIMYHGLSIMYGQNYTPYIILNALYNYAGSALVASGFFLILVLVSRGKWLGLGDVKLAFLMGLILGWPNILVALFLAFMSGAVVGVGLILISIASRGTTSAFGGGRTPASYTLKSQIPFGPFLILGTFAALFWGQKI